MQLSEAIRLGAMLHPQGFYWSHLKDTNGTVIATCALGAAYDAGYAHPFEVATPARCPRCHGSASLSWIVAHLNDTHRWTREAIADWVETVEASTSPAREVAPALPDDAVATPDDQRQAVHSRC